MPSPTQADSTVETFSLGDFTLGSGEVLPDAYLAFRTFGTKGAPLIVYPTWYSGTITDGNVWLVSTKEHTRKALDPEKYFIVLPALFGNGESTSPSNHPLGVDLAKATFYDNVKAQHRLVTEKFGYNEIHLVTGWSMGAATSFQWASQYPEMVKRCAPFCGAARVAPHNYIMLEAVKGAILTDSEGYADGKYMQVHKKQPMRGLKAVARVYAGCGFSQAYYRRDGFRTEFGIQGGLEAVLKEFWEAYFTQKDANNLLYMLWTWQHADIGMQEKYANKVQLQQHQAADLQRDEETDDSFKRALQAITAQTIIMPSRTDLYFPPEDSELEQKIMGSDKAELKVIESDRGHWAGFDREEDTKFLDDCLYNLLEQK
jgi:homoserine acetyltransferase